MDSNVRVIHISGMGELDSYQAFDCGCAGFLAKPFKIEELSNKIKECLDNADDQEIPASHFS